MTQTVNYGFELPLFDEINWDDEIRGNWTKLDTELKRVEDLVTVADTWANSTAFVVDQRVLEPTTGLVFRCLVAHTSAGAGTFAADRTANPTYWIQEAVSLSSDAALKSAKNVYTKMQVWKQGANIASAATLTLGDDGNFFEVTGTTTIAAISSTGQDGGFILLDFDGVLRITHDATNLILPKERSIITAPGDQAIFLEYEVGKWRLVSYLSNRADFLALTATSTSIDERHIGQTLLCDASSTAMTLNLATAAALRNGARITVIKTDATANTVTLDPNGAEEINGATNYVLNSQYDAVTIVSNNAAWFVVSEKT